MTKKAKSQQAAKKRKGRGPDKKPRQMNPNSLKVLETHQFPPGVSGNPSGLPGTDLAAKYAREFFEKHEDGITKSMAKELKGFNAYAYGALADRGYGKVKDRTQFELTGKDGEPLEITVKLVRPALKDMA